MGFRGVLNLTCHSEAKLVYRHKKADSMSGKAINVSEIKALIVNLWLVSEQARALIGKFPSTYQLDGVLTADGLDGAARGGAGGSINLFTPVLAGSGMITARGGFNLSSSTTATYGGGGGGRILLEVTDFTAFSGSYDASGGRDAQNDSRVAGAGTVYIKAIGQDYGQLILDNAGWASAPGRTPFRHVGVQTITGVALVDAGEAQIRPAKWRIEVAGSPWLQTDTFYDVGIQGLTVDLDASDEAGELYTVDSNTENTLTILVDDVSRDLYSEVGSELIGVHVFESLTIQNGASADFGGDRTLSLQ